MIRLIGAGVGRRSPDGLMISSFSTGIEYAEAMKQVGKKQPVDPKTYKCSEYFAFHSYTFFDKEVLILESFGVLTMKKIEKR
ncbi:unnamed protein product [Gongylonema pulchrum]|uniref:NADH dehydrogenase [ubiquinone] flavoprotein 3, mitochondrial n=1 Tax=Gongylonema pulchrum TaxID=637853 RepID=A0A183E241_9BILA|nr:unnamed protein product [Gongylonema pulchrum]